MVDVPSPWKTLASLRHLLPTLWYFAADSRRLIDPLRQMSFTGLTRPWAFVGVCTLLFALARAKLQSTYPDQITFDDLSSWTLEEKIDIWLTLILPFMIIYHLQVSRKVKDPPPFVATVSVWLYIFGVYVLSVLTLSDALTFVSGSARSGQPFILKVIYHATTWYLFVFRSFWIMTELHKADSDEEIDNVTYGGASALGMAFLFLFACAVVFKWTGWWPSNSIAPILSLIP